MFKTKHAAGPLLAATMAADNIAMAAYLTVIMIIPAKNVMEAKHAEHEQAVTPQQAVTVDRQLASEDIHVPDNVASVLTGTAEFQIQRRIVVWPAGTADFRIQQHGVVWPSRSLGEETRLGSCMTCTAALCFAVSVCSVSPLLVSGQQQLAQ